MKTCIVCKELKLPSEFRTSKTTKDKLHSYCIPCHREKLRNNNHKKREYHKELKRQYYYDNHEAEKEKRRLHYANNKALYLANFYLREERVKQATPLWLNEQMKSDIVLKYKISQRLKEIHCIKYHVDHIVPIWGENVCGLHVPWNLQVITEEENLRKSNKHE